MALFVRVLFRSLLHFNLLLSHFSFTKGRKNKNKKNVVLLMLLPLPLLVPFYSRFSLGA